MKYTEGQFKQWGYDLAEREFSDHVFTWQEYDRIREKDGVDAANLAQSKANDEGKVLIKDSIADAFLQQINHNLHLILACIRRKLLFLFQIFQ